MEKEFWRGAGGEDFASQTSVTSDLCHLAAQGCVFCHLTKENFVCHEFILVVAFLSKFRDVSVALVDVFTCPFRGSQQDVLG